MLKKTIDIEKKKNLLEKLFLFVPYKFIFVISLYFIFYFLLNINLIEMRKDF